MNLKEVLTLMQQYKQLNESYKSNKLDKIFKSFENSNLTLEIKSLTKYYWENNPKNIYHIKNIYQSLAKQNVLTQEMLDDPDKRQQLLGIKYVQKYKYDKINATKEILDSLILKTNSHIGISEIKDDDLIYITPAEAKLKPYKSLLQFWFNYKDELVAICKDNTIICYITIKKENYDVNYDFKGDSTSKNIFYAEKTEENIKKQEEFINKAFKIIPEYNIYVTNKDIKNKLNGVNNVKKLQSEQYISYIYAVNEEGMKAINYNEIAKSRSDYKEYLIKEKEKLEKIISGKYKNFNKQLVNKVSLIKSEAIPNNILNSISSYIAICFEVYNDMQDFMLNTLNNYKPNYTFTNTKTSGDLTYNNKNYEYGLKLKSLFPDNITEYKYRKYYSMYFSFKSIGDCFVVINLFLEKLIYTCVDLLNIIEQYNKLKDNDNVNDLVKLLNTLKSKYNDVLFASNYNNIHIIQESISILQGIYIDPLPILNKLKNNKPEERYD